MGNLDMWDYIAAFLLLLCVWMLFYGIKLCREADKAGFDERKLRNKVYGAMVVAIVYLVCRFAG